ncbi:MAG TPA: acetyltransferase [Planctomycetaceae bacterium]|nr:acetyltransferase [Planctomycetaceae bacterium]
MGNIVIFGTKAFAEIAHYYFTHDSPHTVAAFTVDAAYLKEPMYKGLPVVAFEEVERAFPPDEHGMFVAVGFHKMNQLRAETAARAEAKQYELASFVSSKADVAADLKVHPNTMIMERAVIQPFARIGKNSVIWSTSRIGFHSCIGDHCWITSALFGESVTVGDYSFVGLNATIASFVSLGRRNLIGAGALVLHDTKDGEIYRSRASRASRVKSDRLPHFGT